MSKLLSAAQPPLVNGVNVSALIGTIQAIQANPELAKFNFRAKNTWLGGDRNRSTIKEFTGACAEQRVGAPGHIAESAEPPVLLGEDAAPNPGEWLLHALIACITTTTAYHAAARSIEIKAIDSDIDGDLDLRGFLGLSRDVPKGYQSIRVRMRVNTAASVGAIRELIAMSSVLEMVSKAAPVDVSVETY